MTKDKSYSIKTKISYGLLILSVAIGFPALAIFEIKAVPLKESVYTLENLSTQVDTNLPIEIWYNTTGYNLAYLKIKVINVNQNSTVYEQVQQIESNTVNNVTYNLPLYMFPQYPNLDDGLYLVELSMLGINTTTGSTGIANTSFYFSVNMPLSEAYYDIDAKQPYPQIKTLNGNEEYTFYWPFRLDGIKTDLLYVRVYLISNNGDIMKTFEKRETFYNPYWKTVTITVDTPNVYQVTKGKLIFEARDDHGQYFQYSFDVTIVPNIIKFESVKVLPSTTVKVGSLVYFVLNVRNYSPEDKSLTLEIDLPWNQKVTKTIYLPAETSKKVVVPVMVPSNIEPTTGYAVIKLFGPNNNLIDSKTIRLTIEKQYKVITGIQYSFNRLTDELSVTLLSDLDEPAFVTVYAKGYNVSVTPTTKMILISKDSPARLDFKVTPLAAQGEVDLSVYYNNKQVFEKKITLTFQLPKKETYQNITKVKTNITAQPSEQQKSNNWWIYGLIAILGVIAVYLGYKVGKKGEEEVE